MELMDFIWAVAGFLGAFLHIVFVVAAFVLLVLFVVFVVELLKIGIAALMAEPAKPAPPAQPKWPRRIATMEGDVLVYRSGKVRLIDERGNVWKAKLHDDLLGEGEV